MSTVGEYFLSAHPRNEYAKNCTDWAGVLKRAFQRKEKVHNLAEGKL